jgi:hypothetical protein
MVRVPVSDEEWARTLIDAGLLPRPRARARAWHRCDRCRAVVRGTEVKWWQVPNSRGQFRSAGSCLDAGPLFDRSAQFEEGAR